MLYKHDPKKKYKTQVLWNGRQPRPVRAFKCSTLCLLLSFTCGDIASSATNHGHCTVMTKVIFTLVNLHVGYGYVGYYSPKWRAVDEACRRVQYWDKVGKMLAVCKIWALVMRHIKISKFYSPCISKANVFRTYISIKFIRFTIDPVITSWFTPCISTHRSTRR